jgi:hypothetical protein
MLQNIINKSNELTINRRRIIGVQYTRNEIVKTAQTPTINPWKFTIKAANGFIYSQVRDMLEELDRLDRNNYEWITFGDNPNMSWMFSYRGAASVAQLDALQIVSFTGNQLMLENFTDIPLGTVLFKANDIIQVGSFCYTSVSQVTYQGFPSVTVTTHRPNISSIDPAGSAIVVGNGVQFPVVCVNMPTYKLVPGAFTRNSASGAITNNAIVEFDSDFELVEYTGV